MTAASDTPVPQTPLADAQRALGDWNPTWETLGRSSPAFLEAYLQLRSVPFKQGPLEPKVKELIMVAINAATTHLYAPGVRRHIRNALACGASGDEILEAIQLTTLLGIHACNLAVPILDEELKAAHGDPIATRTDGGT